MRILVIKLTSMGDVLFALSIIADIKSRFPGSSIDWVVDQDFAALVRFHCDIDSVFQLPLRQFSRVSGGKKLSLIVDVVRCLSKIRQTHYDVLIDMQGVIKSGLVSLIARSNKKWAYPGPHLELPPMHRIYTDHWEPVRELPAVLQHRVFAGAGLGYTPDLLKTVFNFRRLGAAAGDCLASTTQGDGQTALLAPFSSKEDKQLDQQRMGEIIQRLSRNNFKVVMVAGTTSERESGLELAARVNCNIDLIFRPIENFGDFQQRLRQSRLCIGVDTGIIHVSAAYGIPTIGIFSTSAIEIYGPHHWAAQAWSLHATDSDLVEKINTLASKVAGQC